VDKSIDFSPKRLHPGGKRQIVKERLRSIETDNKTLYQKMHEIEHRGFGTKTNFSINEQRHDHLIIGPVRKKGAQMKAIAKENLKLLNRLQDIKSSYDIGRMEHAR
jgi:hypothetical protein